MQIKLPATLTARFEPDEAVSYYDEPETGTVFIEFGGYEVAQIRVTERGDRMVNDGSYYQSEEAANEELSAFVAAWLSKIFMNALTERS